jgi:KRAB domain-containing zinc finger protein
MKRHLGERDHVCHECGKSFTRRDGLQKHLACFHSDIKAFRCKICSKDLKGHLLQHLRTHLNERPYSCDVCKSSFAQRSQLTVHLRIHSGEKPYLCKFCQRAFAHSTALKLHERRHTGEKPFKCPLCPSTAFVQLPHLKKHMRCVHKSSKPYMCTSCRCFFSTKKELVAHGECKVTGMEPDRLRERLTILLSLISTPERLKALGLGKRPIDDVLKDSIASSGRKPYVDANPVAMLRRNAEILLEWTVPKQYMEKFKTEQRSTDDLLVELTS